MKKECTSGIFLKCYLEIGVFSECTGKSVCFFVNACLCEKWLVAAGGRAHRLPICMLCFSHSYLPPLRLCAFADLCASNASINIYFFSLSLFANKELPIFSLLLFAPHSPFSLIVFDTDLLIVTLNNSVLVAC